MIECPDNTYDALAWGSHLPALLGCLGATSGRVLELGVGHFSTPALHAYCGAAKRDLVSLESNVAWFQYFASKFELKNHVFRLAEFEETGYSKCRTCWSVALIDNSPGGERRKKDFAALLPVSDFVVVHDFHRENEEAITPLLTGNKFWVCNRYQPPTLVASLTRSIPESIFCL